MPATKYTEKIWYRQRRKEENRRHFKEAKERNRNEKVYEVRDTEVSNCAEIIENLTHVMETF